MRIIYIQSLMRMKETYLMISRGESMNLKVKSNKIIIIAILVIIAKAIIITLISRVILKTLSSVMTIIHETYLLEIVTKL